MTDAAAKRGLRALIECDAVGYERLPMLEVVCDRFQRTFATSVRNLTSDSIDLRLQSVGSGRFGELIEQAGQPGMFGVFRFMEWDSFGVVAVEPALIYAIVDALLGGSPAGATSTRHARGRTFTSIETSLASRIMQLALADLGTAFAPIAPIRIALERVETSSQFAAITGPSNVTASCRFELELDGSGGSFHLLLPHTSLEPVRDKLVQRFMGEKLGADAVWRAHFEQELRCSELLMRAVMAERQMSLRQVGSWRVGDTIPFATSPEQQLRLCIGDHTLAKAQLGRRGSHCAVRFLTSIAGE